LTIRSFKTDAQVTAAYKGTLFSLTGKTNIRRVVLKRTTPSRPSDIGWFVITLEPIGAGKIGRACVSGVCPALVKYEEDFHYFADITDGDSGKLTSGERGAAELLWVSGSAGAHAVQLDGLSRAGYASVSRRAWLMVLSSPLSRANSWARNPSSASPMGRRGV